jgi:hypothetical protein
MIKIFWHPILTLTIFVCGSALAWLVFHQLDEDRKTINDQAEKIKEITASHKTMDSLVIEFMDKDRLFHKDIIEKFESWSK